MHVAVGDALALEDDLVEAGRAYLRAVVALNRVGAAEVVDVYLRLSAVNARRGKPGVARRYLDRAAALAPDHPGVLRRLVAWLAEREAWDELPACEEALLDAVASDPLGLELELLRSGDRWWRRASDVVTARRRYEEAVVRFPHSERARVRLRALERSIPTTSGFAPASEHPAMDEACDTEPPVSVTRWIGATADEEAGDRVLP